VHPDTGDGAENFFSLVLKRRFERALLGGEGKIENIVLWGAGTIGQSVTAVWSGPRFTHIVSGYRKELAKDLGGKKVLSPSIINSLAPQETAILLGMSGPFQVDVIQRLRKWGFALPQHQIDGRAFSPGVGNKFVLPVATGGSPAECLRALEELGFDYRVLRGTERLSGNQDGDVDVIVQGSASEEIFNLDVWDKSGQSKVEVDFFVWAPEKLNSAQILPLKLWNSLFEDFEMVHGVKVATASKRIDAVIYHLLFDKHSLEVGFETDGKPSRNGPWVKSRLRQEIAQHLPAESAHIVDSMVLMHEYLASKGYLPELDIVRRIENERIRQAGQASFLSGLSEGRRVNSNKELIVFIIRGDIFYEQTVDQIAQSLSEKGLTLIHTQRISSANASNATQGIRGGVWAESNASRQSGVPSGFMVFVDHKPKGATSKQKIEHPYLSNEIYGGKSAVRAELARVTEFPDGLFFHTPDDEREAFDYLRIIAPEWVDDFRMKLDET